MTIRPGEDWGRRVSEAGTSERVSDDAAAARLRGSRVVLEGGDLHRSLGSPAVPSRRGEHTELDVDVLDVRVEMRDGRTVEMSAVSSVVSGRWNGGGRVVAVLNTGFLGRRNLAPRAHPNDGVFEVLTMSASMSRRERREAWRRSLTGSHLPHPDLSVVRAASWTWERTGPIDPLRIDGRVVRGWRRVVVDLHPDGLVVVV